MNVELYDSGVNNVNAFKAVLEDGSYKGGTILHSTLSAMIDVSESLCCNERSG